MHLHHQDNEEEGNIILLSLVSPSVIKTWLFSKFSWWHKLALFQVVYKRLVLDCDQVYQFVTRHFLPVIVYIGLYYGITINVWVNFLFFSLSPPSSPDLLILLLHVFFPSSNNSSSTTSFSIFFFYKFPFLFFIFFLYLKILPFSPHFLKLFFCYS